MTPNSPPASARADRRYTVELRMGPLHMQWINMPQKGACTQALRAAGLFPGQTIDDLRLTRKF
jgi:hypothetical protein